jgi:Transposase DDE domain group 1
VQNDERPPDERIIVRRVPRPTGEQPTLGEHPDWRYAAFTTNTPAGQVQWLDARHRTQAHIEDKMKELKACGGENLPSIDWHRNSAWLQLAALACTLNAWLRHLALHGELAKAEPKALPTPRPPPHTSSTPAAEPCSSHPAGAGPKTSRQAGNGSKPSTPADRQATAPTSSHVQAGPWNRPSALPSWPNCAPSWT